MWDAEIDLESAFSRPAVWLFTYATLKVCVIVALVTYIEQTVVFTHTSSEAMCWKVAFGQGLQASAHDNRTL